MIDGEGGSMKSEIECPSAVVQALDSLRLKLGCQTSAREAEAAEALDECLSRMREGESIDPCLDEYPWLGKLLGVMLNAAQSLSDAPGASPSDQFRAQSRARMPGVLGNAWMMLVRACTSQRTQGAAIVLAMIVAIGGSVLSAGAVGTVSQDSALASKCTLSVLSGEVQVRGPGSDAWVLAEDGITVEAGGRVKTTADSHALLTFFEGSTVKLEPNTDIQRGNRDRLETAGGQDLEPRGEDDRPRLKLRDRDTIGVRTGEGYTV